MNKPKIKINSAWVYCGEEDGYGFMHAVTSANALEVVTFSEMTAFDDDEHGGYSWIGTPADFLIEFKPL